MKNKGLQRGLSLLLCLLLVIGILPVTVHGWDNYVQCEYCGAGCGDDYICSGGDHCSEDSGRDCYSEHHCLECGECEDSATYWCEECHMCASCAETNGCHCPECGSCYEGDGLMHCYACMACEDCVGQICDHNLCVDCGIPDGHHCPDCWQCGYELDRCGDCGRCVDCCLCEVEGFHDVAENVYYYDPILWAVKRGITNGTGEGLFSPARACSRAQVVTFLWRYAGEPEARGGSGFTDVPKDAFYYKAVCWAVEQGITNGTSATTFSPSKECSRAAIVTFLWRFLGQPAPRGGNPFQDVKTADYFHDAVVWAAEEGVTNGTSATAFSPYNICNRGQVVTFLYRTPKYLAIRIQPADHQMTSSQEDVEFSVSIVGGVGPYTYQWVVCRDNDETWYQPEHTYDTVSILSEEFTDYDFEDYNGIGVYCIITDCTGSSVTTEFVEVFPYTPMRIVTQPADYQMTSSQEDAEFTVSIAGGVGPYTYQWVVCRDNNETWYQPELTYDTVSVLCEEFSDYDFDAYNGIGVYCIISDSTGNSIESDFANIWQR